MGRDQSHMTLARFFAGTAESIFQSELGVADPPLIDYVSDLLFRFVRSDTLHRIRSLTGKPLVEVNEMLAEADARLGDARREVHRHIGDFTLFWAGLYPEALRKRSGATVHDRFGDYVDYGKRAYLIASQIDTDQDQAAPSELLERLSREFEMCAYGLREVRREWERREDEDDRPRSIWIT